MSPNAFDVVRCEVFRLSLALHEPFQIALMTSHRAENVAVRLTTREGREGWGEASPLHAVTGETVGTCIAASEFLGRALVGKSSLETKARTREMADFLPHNPGIRSAFDMALYDVAAQAAGLPLYALLGGAERELITDLTLGIGTPEAASQRAGQAIEMGFRNLKMKLGLDIGRDQAAVASVRDRVGSGVKLRLDANQAWSRQEAVENLRLLSQYDVQFCEQPVRHEDKEGLRYVTERSPIPPMADEAVFSSADLFEVASRGLAPYANLKVAKAGGIGAVLQIDAVAASSGIRCMLGCMMESRLGLTASAHVALACTTVKFLDLDTVFELAEDPVKGGVRYEGDRMVVPREPGLGAALDAGDLTGERVCTIE